MINLFVSGDPEDWESEDALFPVGRCLTEYILPQFKEMYGSLGSSEIEAIKGFPCIFVYEAYSKKDAYIGTITDISVRQKNVMISIQKTGEKIRHEDLIDLYPLLDFGTWEHNRTHWTIKNVDIKKLEPYFSSNKQKKTTVFISYSWSPPSNQKSVFELVQKLQKDGISVVYDKNDLHLGQDINFFMEQALNSHQIDFVLVICNKDYAEKANARSGGVGYEAELILTHIKSQPLQTKFIPVVFETDESGTAFLPAFFKERLYVDLTNESGYKELLSEIKAATP